MKRYRAGTRLLAVLLAAVLLTLPWGGMPALPVTDNWGGVPAQVSAEGPDDPANPPEEPQEPSGKPAQEPLQFRYSDPVISYEQGRIYSENTLSGGSGEGAVLFAADSGDTASVSVDLFTGEVLVEAPGTVVIKAVKLGGELYEDASATYTLTIRESANGSFAFSADVPRQLTYNDSGNYIPLSVQGGSLGVTWSVVSGDAAFVWDDGLIVVKAGTVEVRADRARSFLYREATATVKITIDKAPQELSFADPDPGEIFYGQPFANPAAVTEDPTATDHRGHADNPVLYTVLEGTDIAQTDGNGQLFFADDATGTVKVRASIAGDDCYLDAEAEYTLQVSYPDTPETPYTIYGQQDPDRGWFTSDVVIAPPEGYEISTSSALRDNDWQSELVLSEEGSQNVTVYLRRDGAITEGIEIPAAFLIDKTPPEEVDITVDGASVLSADGAPFSLLYNTPVTVRVTAQDAVSGVDRIEWQKIESESDYNPEGFTDIYDEAAGVTVLPSDRFILYFRITDRAGNAVVVNSRGVILDDRPPVGEQSAPAIDILPDQANANGYFAGDAGVWIRVADPAYAGSTRTDAGYRSGLARVTYRIAASDTGAVAEGTLLDLSAGQTDRAVRDVHGLIESWSGRIVADAARFNSNGISVEVTAWDRAGNVRTTRYEGLKIDSVAPRISVSYDNNSGDAAFANDYTDAYFSTGRTATVQITEHNFDPAGVYFALTGSGGSLPYISGWSSAGDVHTATLFYGADGDYTFDVGYADPAGNVNLPVDYGYSQAPQRFTIDTTDPVISISWDNNDVRNGFYFNQPRTATITVTEHNFDPSRAVIEVSAEDRGAAIAAPAASAWSSYGDTHTAAVRCDADGIYTIRAAFTDKAGRAAADPGAQQCCIDRTPPAVTVTGPSDESANNNGGPQGIAVEVTDTNLEAFVPQLTALIRTGEDTFERRTVETGESADISYGRRWSIANLEEDGIYRLTVTAYDLAGNAWTTAWIPAADGTFEAVETAAEEPLVTFSVNRGGSTYEPGTDTLSLAERQYVQRVDADLTFTEINVDPLVSYTVTINGTPLTEGEDYRVAHTGGGDAWERYDYTLPRALFSDEGEYTVVLSSEDRASNRGFSDVKGARIDFVVDRTAPVVGISGMASDGRYRTEGQTVTLVPTDDGGRLQSLSVWTVDEEGEELEILAHWEGEAFLDALEEGGGAVQFVIPRGLYQNVRITCDDAADYRGEENILYEETFTNISVTPNIFLIFWANVPLRRGVLGAAAGVLIVLAAVWVYRRKRSKRHRF